MLDKRQSAIFKLIVEEYIKSAKPIGSQAICDTLECSSATVRNEMVYLEEVGLLQKTHTSSGRIPSEKGYRYYVDNLMKKDTLNNDDMNKLETIFSNQAIQLNDAVNLSLEIIANLTNCTSLVLGDSIGSSCLRKVEVVVLSEDKILGIFITDRGYIEHKQLEIFNVSLEEIRQTVELINKMLEGTLISEIITKLEFEIKPVIASCIRQHKAVYEAFYNAFKDFNLKTPEVKYLGKNNIFNQPEFNDVEKIKKIIHKLDDDSIIRNISQDEDGINIYIGHENDFDDDVTVIKTAYNLGGVKKNIAFVGPKRMEYDRVVSMLDYIKKLLEEKDGDYFE